MEFAARRMVLRDDKSPGIHLPGPCLWERTTGLEPATLTLAR